MDTNFEKNRFFSKRHLESEKVIRNNSDSFVGQEEEWQNCVGQTEGVGGAKQKERGQNFMGQKERRQNFVGQKLEWQNFVGQDNGGKTSWDKK